MTLAELTSPFVREAVLPGYEIDLWNISTIYDVTIDICALLDSILDDLYANLDFFGKHSSSNALQCKNIVRKAKMLFLSFFLSVHACP